MCKDKETEDVGGRVRKTWARFGDPEVPKDARSPCSELLLCPWRYEDKTDLIRKNVESG